MSTSAIFEPLERRAMRSVSPDPGSTLATARDIGSATDITIHESVGTNAATGLNDPTDYYKLKMDAPGTLQVTMNTDDSTFFAQNSVQIVQDLDNNGVIELRDIVRQTGSGQNVATGATLAAGTYFVGVLSSSGGSNYHVRVTADYAGETPDTQRAMGSLDTGKSFNDFIGAPDDLVDQYKFHLSASRPVHLVSIEQDGTSLLELFKDSNHNGIADPFEGVLGTSSHHVDELLVTVGAGDYIVEVLAGNGTGTYQLFAEARPDLAGNTLATAKNLGAVNGLVRRDDFVSKQDPVDLFKFT